MAAAYGIAPPSYNEVVDDPSQGGRLQASIPATQVELSIRCRYKDTKLR